MVRNTRFNSFMGSVLYEHLVPQTHFLRRLNGLMDWIDLCDGIFQVYKGQFQLGAAAINPVTMFKMLLLSYLYNQSDRETERLCNENIPFKYFIEIALDEAAPDHSSLSVFRTRIIEYYADASYFEKLFEKVVYAIAAHPEIKFGDSQIIDSTHIEAKVKAVQTNHTTNDDGNNRNSSDPDAQWGTKGFEQKKDKDGNQVLIPKYFFGYKKHSSIENNHRLITSTLVTGGAADDGGRFPDLIWHDVKMRGRFRGSYGDKGYDYGENHFLLNVLDLADGISLKQTRLKDDTNHAIWHTIASSDFYRDSRHHRYKIEATNADQKNNHGLRRCRYLGTTKTRLQCLMTDIVYNLKKTIKVLYGISPRTVAG